MYIGLFLLIPFLNLIYNNLFTKKTKSLLLITMILLTAAHSLVNSYAVLIPDWWINIYPITYYFIGAYIFEYKDDIKISLKLHFLLIIICIIAFGTYCYYRSYNDIFIWGQWSDWGGFINSIDTVLIFVFLLRLDLTNIPAFLKRGIMYISEISLGIYLVSWIFDNYNYPKLIEAISDMPDRLPFYLVIVPFNFICSSILSAIIYMIDRVISKSIKKYIDFLKSKTEIPV